MERGKGIRGVWVVIPFYLCSSTQDGLALCLSVQATPATLKFRQDRQVIRRLFKELNVITVLNNFAWI